MALFKSRGSRHMRSLLGLTMTNILETHSVGSVTGARIPVATISSSFSLIWLRRATGTRRGGCTTGGTLSSVTMWYSPGRSPKPSKTSLYPSRRSAIPVVTCTPGVSLSPPLEFDGLSQSLIVLVLVQCMCCMITVGQGRLL